MRSFLLAFLLVGCASSGIPAQTGSLNKSVRNDLFVEVDGKAAYGTLVVPYKETAYAVKIASTTSLDAIFIESCHRSLIKYDKTNQYSFKYTFNADVEKTTCPMKISTLEKGVQKKEYATVVFQEPRFKLEGTLHCNATTEAIKGVGICQGKAEKVQEIEFAEAVKVFSKCPLPTIQEGKKIALALPSGACAYAFSTIAQPFKSAMLYTLGFEEDEYPGESK